ncbi:hypothetical protein O7622_10505 [Micromonospora sp. WMMD1076]|uniref:hypothetical protein n=1 Tax=Micromonospora sp. WMMD1076 TaxID=3016103 RepID=UPI00249B7701|nr:hypothetical protein [Micromonospora sp. WMMD1076]WFF08948.1 hypothetical protein O7622_10505 [Micromonospora sp. WMMD1076]
MRAPVGWRHGGPERGRNRRRRARKTYRLAGGRIVQFWGEQATYGLLRGLGLLPDEPITF